MAVLLGFGLPSSLHAASGTASASATVVNPVAITATNPYLRFPSALGARQLTVKANGALTYAVVLQSVTDVSGGSSTIRTMVTVAFD